MSTTPADTRCPRCGDAIQPDTAFCGNCGEPITRPPGVTDPQDTVTYRPISFDPGTDRSADPMTTGASGETRSPWAQPGTAEHLPHGQDASDQPAAWGGYADATATGHAVPFVAAPTRERGPLGFFLGVLALLLIFTVLALYAYDVWLGQEARETVEDLLPFLR